MMSKSSLLKRQTNPNDFHYGNQHPTTSKSPSPPRMMLTPRTLKLNHDQRPYIPSEIYYQKYPDDSVDALRKFDTVDEHPVNKFRGQFQEARVRTSAGVGRKFKHPMESYRSLPSAGKMYTMQLRGTDPTSPFDTPRKTTEALIQTNSATFNYFRQEYVSKIHKLDSLNSFGDLSSREVGHELSYAPPEASHNSRHSKVRTFIDNCESEVMIPSNGRIYGQIWVRNRESPLRISKIFQMPSGFLLNHENNVLARNYLRACLPEKFPRLRVFYIRETI